MREDGDGRCEGGNGGVGWGTRDGGREMTQKEERETQKGGREVDHEGASVKEVVRGVSRVRSDESSGVEPHQAAPRGDSWFFWIVL